MRSNSCLRWLLAGALAASLPVAVQAASGHSMGMGFGGGGVHHDMAGSGRGVSHFSGGHRFGHDHFFDHDHFFHHDRFFHHHDHFFFVFDFASFGFPWWWGWSYPYPYYAYAPYDYAYYDRGPAYDYGYWKGLAESVQAELARRGYYHGEVDGEIGSRSRAAIRAFQAAQGLPATGVIDAKLLKALGIPYKKY
jgi:hypothetical protein